MKSSRLNWKMVLIIFLITFVESNAKTYDNHNNIIHEPTIVLDYSTYFGGSKIDVGEDIVVVRDGNVYITGYTSSDDFPTKNAYQGLRKNNSGEVFLCKLDTSGNILYYSTYFGGYKEDYGLDLVVDTDDNVYVTGGTESPDFPNLNAIQGS